LQAPSVPEVAQHRNLAAVRKVGVSNLYRAPGFRLAQGRRSASLHRSSGANVSLYSPGASSRLPASDRVSTANARSAARIGSVSNMSPSNISSSGIFGRSPRHIRNEGDLRFANSLSKYSEISFRCLEPFGRVVSPPSLSKITICWPDLSKFRCSR
jgi:hypothetical protein